MKKIFLMMIAAFVIRTHYISKKEQAKEYLSKTVKYMVLKKIELLHQQHKNGETTNQNRLKHPEVAHKCRESLLEGREIFKESYKIIEGMLEKSKGGNNFDQELAFARKIFFLKEKLGYKLTKDEKPNEESLLLISKLSVNARYYDHLQKTFIKEMRERVENNGEMRSECSQIHKFLESILHIIKNFLSLGNTKRIGSVIISPPVEIHEIAIDNLRKLFEEAEKLTLKE